MVSKFYGDLEGFIGFYGVKTYPGGMQEKTKDKGEKTKRIEKTKNKSRLLSEFITTP
jgi:hypothetical protein